MAAHLSVGSFDSYHSSESAPAAAAAASHPFGGNRYQDQRTRSIEHHHHHHRHTYTDSAIFTTPSHSPPSSPCLAPPLSSSSSSSPSRTHSLGDSSKSAFASSLTATSPSSISPGIRHSHSPASARALVTPWELRQPAALGPAPPSPSSIAIAEPKPTSFASFSLQRSPSRSRRHDRPDHPSRPRTMSPVALATPPTPLHHSPSNSFLGAAFARASSMSKSHHSWRGAGAARPPPASAFTTRPPGMATQMPVLARRNARRIGYTKWSPRWIVIDHVDGVLHVYKDPHSLVPTDSIQVSSSHTTIQHAIDRNTGFQMLKVYYLSSRYRFRTDPNVLHAWNDSIPDLALRPGTSPSDLNLLLDALNRSATAPDRAPIWIPTKAENSATALRHEQVSSSMPSSYANSSASSDSSSSARDSVVFDAPPTEPEAWSAPSTLARSNSTRKTPPPLILRPMSASPLMRRPASAPLLSPTSAAAVAAAATPSATAGHRPPMPSPWQRETASAGFVFSPSAYESAPYSVSSTRSSTGSKYMDELLFLDPYFQSQKHHPLPVAHAVEAQAYQGHAGPRSPLNPFAG